MTMKNNKKQKVFYKSWWFILLLIVLSFPVWPFLLGGFLVYKVFQRKISRGLKYAMIVLILLATLFVGSAWTAAVLAPKPTKEAKTESKYQPSPLPRTATPEASQKHPEEIQGLSTSTNISLSPSPAQNRIIAKVKKVIDGDTIELENGQKVRYIGIDAPETDHPSKPVQCFGKEASAKNRELVEGKTVELEKDVSETDQYARLLRYVWLGDILVNEYLVKEGYAQSSSYPPDIKYQDRFIEAQRQARKEQKGLWGSYCNDWNSSFTEQLHETKSPTEPPLVTDEYVCNCNKPCSQISSCKEAYFQLNNCSCSQRDADKDGVPCETICSGG